MGNLAFLGSRRVNGVSALHTELMRKTVFRDFNALYPDRIVNKTNGITFRRWLFQANPGLTNLIADAHRPGVRSTTRSRLARPRAASPTTRRSATGSPPCGAPTRWRSRALVAERTGVTRRPGRDLRRPHQAHPRVQAPAAQPAARRSRSTTRCGRSPTSDWVPRVKIFAGKAAPGYQQAKLIIKLANDVGARRQRRPGRCATC